MFKKTLPFFWIPAHTITFLLPPDFQVLFAAILGIVLGIILAVAGLSKKNDGTAGSRLLKAYGHFSLILDNYTSFNIAVK
ncbi:Mpv17/PMP22 family protein [uncultured Desulfobacter sp.]|uniref:Mpv17/PMP22 family protein n=1 Tax=uncultured Desulfobacter sp. TaxID=240139 RepID=UPI002AA76289|nr:Mpv17/PMP22 family protein [uncultured Desulfobacter sp.]